MRLIHFIRDIFFRIDLFLHRVRLPVTWGNQVWYEYKEFIFPYGTISPKNEDWTDYSTPNIKETADLAIEAHPNHTLRRRLHSQILDLLLENGAPSERPVCIFTSGGTASGKTSAVGEFLKSVAHNFVRLDYDKIKFLLPEYPVMLAQKIKFAASHVQSESAKLGGKAFKRAYGKKMSVVYEKTLDDANKTREDVKKLRRRNYKIIVIAAHLTQEKGLVRAETRFRDKGRYVPEDVISGIYSRVPCALHDIRNKVDEIYLFDNNGEALELMFVKNANGPQIINQDLYKAYLTYVGSQFDLSN